MTLLALDLGTSMGFAILKDNKFISGTKKFAKYKEQFGERFYNFRKWLLDIIERHHVDVVYFERVYGHTGTEAAHVYGGLMYALGSICFQHNIPCNGLTVQAIKKFMTGKGNATKEEMIAAAQQKGFAPKTHDEADAIAIMLLAIKDLSTKNILFSQNKNGSFQPLRDSGYRAPGISLASENFQALYFTKK
jgi:Holliday junction resolvasome RuvABC endonuclease subunit